ncbi:MAG TPA: serine--tRNA ligase [Candidatus Kapabacteria bacterium]|nr:serine--tRNA ligase [Candidatus Kapabacteria bacterium]
MVDIKIIREQPDVVRTAVKNKQETGALEKFDRIIALDKTRREAIKNVEEKKASLNKISERIGQTKRKGESANEKDMVDSANLSGEIKELDKELRDVDAQLSELLLWIPNIPHESVPVGTSAKDNKVEKTWGELPQNDFKRLDHMELSKKLGLFDFERGAKISGSGFPVYTGKGAKLERALINFMLDVQTNEHGYKEIFPPFVVNELSLRGTAQIPKSFEDMYRCADDDLFLIPTAEVPLTNLHRDETLKGEELPIRYSGYSACFRREAGSYGKDTKGFLRVHEFNKVELVKFTAPETSFDELESLTRNAETILEKLNIPYRRLLLCTGDMSFASAKTYDLEAWAPAEQKWLEVSSCSNLMDFQARRANIRFKRDAKSKPEFVHTLNGSGLATSRLIVALLENHQTPDGTVVIPKVLQPYTGFAVIS